jgi:hypothetical protein
MNGFAVFLGATLAKLLDPLAFIIAIIVTTFSRNKIIIPVAAIFAALLSELFITSMNSRSFGENSMIFYGFIASMIHASLAFYLIGKFRKN